MTKSELRRIFFDWHFWIAVLGVALSMAFVALRRNNRVSVLDAVVSSFLTYSLILQCICCVFSYAFVFCEDFERKYIYLYLLRIGKRKAICRYALTKIVYIFVSSVLVMILGVLLFSVIFSFFVPWCSYDGGVYDLAAVMAYGNLVNDIHPIVYCFFTAVHMGMYAGVLSLCAALASLFISNSVMILLVPVVLDMGIKVSKFYDYYNGVSMLPINIPSGNNLAIFVRAATINFGICIPISLLIIWKIQRRL